MTEPAIQIEQLTVAGGRRTILALDHLRVERGEVLAVLGPNGAGKSTLLKCCVGMVRPSHGSLHVLGHDVGRMSRLGLTRLRRRVAYVAQLLAPGAEMRLTLREVVAVGRTGQAGLLRPLRPDDWQLVDHWLDRLGLRPLANAPYGVLSGGEQRKTLLAMAMTMRPDVLLLDEPTANLDVYWREQIVATLEQLLAESDLTLLLVCHDLEAIPRGTRRTLILRDGRPLTAGPPADVLRPELAGSLYGPGLTVLQRGGRYMLAPSEQSQGR
jgi:ABC-type cobalamin/Fe3+-siderophores transport system ATPase subunit